MCFALAIYSEALSKLHNQSAYLIQTVEKSWVTYLQKIPSYETVKTIPHIQIYATSHQHNFSQKYILPFLADEVTT